MPLNRDFPGFDDKDDGGLDGYTGGGGIVTPPGSAGKGFGKGPQGPKLQKGSGDPVPGKTKQGPPLQKHTGDPPPGTTKLPDATTTPTPTQAPNDAPPIRPRPNVGAPPSRTDTVLPITQPLPVIYGNAVSCGGQIVYDHVVGNNTRIVVYLVSWGPINSISNITLDGKAPVLIAATATVYLGTSVQTVDSSVNADNALWTSGLPGIAYVVVTYASPTTANPPVDVTRFLCDVQGMMVRDPRTDATLVSRFYRDNPALSLADYMTSPHFGGSIADAQMDFAGSITTSANDDDVLLADGTSKRFTIGIRLDAARPFEDWKETLRAHAELNVVYNNGLYQIWTDKSQAASSIVFTDVGTSANIINAGSLKVRGSAQVPTRIKVNFFNATSGKPDVAIDESELLAPGLVDLVETTYDLQGIRTYDQAKRIAKYLRKRGSIDKEATLSVLQDGGIQVLPGVVVTITSQQLAWTNQLALVTQCSALGGVWTITVEPYDATVYDDTQKVFVPAALISQSNTFDPVLDIATPLASVGARILVAPTTKLSGDLSTGATSIIVNDNTLASGDRIYFESSPAGVAQTEYMAVTSAASGTGPYTYSVTRNLAATGAKSWRAGDAVVNTGQTGSGFVDIYAVRGVKASTEHGPSIVGNVRNSATFNDWTPRWAVGNLNGLYGYVADTYGAAFGVPTGAWIKIDPLNGVRIGFNATTNVQIDASGNASFSGAITATSGTIGGWTIGATTLSATNMIIDAANSKITANSGSIVIDGGTGTISAPTLTVRAASFTASLTCSGANAFTCGSASFTGISTITTGSHVDCGGVFKISGTQVVAARGAAVADATNATDVITQLNAWLARARSHGLIS